MRLFFYLGEKKQYFLFLKRITVRCFLNPHLVKRLMKTEYHCNKFLYYREHPSEDISLPGRQLRVMKDVLSPVIFVIFYYL